MKKIHLSILFSFWVLFSKSQTNLFQTNPLNWDTVKIKHNGLEVNPDYKNENAVILFEKQHISIINGNVSLTRLYRIKFNTEEGIKNYASFFVPMSNDIFSDYYYVGLDKEKKINRPLYADYEILMCGARKVIAPKNYSETSLKASEIIEKIHNEFTYLPTVGFTITKNNSFLWQENKGYTKPISYLFSIPEANVGDVYDIYYKVNIPLVTFLKNNSSRIIFNSAIPKQHFDLSFSYDSDDLFINVINNNIAALPDTVLSKNKNQTITLNYKTSNLFGYKQEQNMRVSELPHLYFYVNSRDYIKSAGNGKAYVAAYDWSHVLYKTTYKINTNNFGMQGKTTLTFDYMKPFNKHYTAPYDDIFVPKKDLAHYITFTDKHHAAVTRMYNKCCENLDLSTDLSCRQRIENFHNYVLNNLSFYTCNERYAKEESLYSLGELAEKGKLFENGRYKLYADYLYQTQANFYRTRMIDKRYESVNQNTYYPPNTTVDYFSIINNNSIESFFPKAGNNGYFIDEYPFYFENNQSITTPFRIIDTSYILPPSFTKTRNSGFSSNIRLHTYTVTIDLEKQTCSFDGNVNLSGQFSTISRSSYLNNSISDSSVSKLYYQKLTDKLSTVEKLKSNIVSLESKFPFKCKVSQSFDYNSLCQKNASDYSIDLSKLTSHLLEKIEKAERSTTYYADFLFHDIFRYTFVFNKPVSVSNEGELKKEPFINSFGAYFTKINSPNPNQITYESNFKILAEKIPAGSFKEVFDFYTNVNNRVSNTVLHFNTN